MADTNWAAELLTPQTSAPPASEPPAKRSDVDWASELLTPGKSRSAEPREITEDPDKTASTVDIGIASLANDPQAQIAYFAKQRGLDPSKYGVVNGRIVYEGEGGKLYPEIPSGWTPTQIMQRAATGVGPSFPAVAGAAAGIASAPMLLTGPLGMAGSMGLTGAAASAGQGIREMLAKGITGQEMDPLRMGIEGVQGALGQGIGAGLTTFAQRNVASDIGRLNSAQVDVLKQKAIDAGIDLTPAELTNLSTLKAQQKYLGNTVSSQDIMQDFYTKRQAQIEDAITGFLNKVSPVDSAEVAGDMGKKAAKKAVDAATLARANQAAPLYKKAFEPQRAWVDTKPVIEALDEIVSKAPDAKYDPSGTIGRTLNNLRQQFFIYDDDGTRSTIPKVKLEQLHGLKMEIDNLLSGGSETPLGNVARRELTKLKENLLAQMDAASPDYKAARKIYSDLSPGIETIKKGLPGKIADLKDIDVSRAPDILFGPKSGPNAIKAAADVMKAADADAWQALKRSWIQDIFDRASNENVNGNVASLAGQFRKNTTGNMLTGRRLQAALEPDEFRALSDLTDVLQAASRVKPIGSDTEFNRLITEAAKDDARPWLAKIVRNMNPAQAVKSFDEFMTNRRMLANGETLANIITSPEAMEQLKALRRLTPGSAKYRAIVGHMLERGSAQAKDAVLTPSNDFAPGAAP